MTHYFGQMKKIDNKQNGAQFLQIKKINFKQDDTQVEQMNNKKNEEN